MTRWAVFRASKAAASDAAVVARPSLNRNPLGSLVNTLIARNFQSTRANS
jgi:hypothetical protein